MKYMHLAFLLLAGLSLSTQNTSNNQCLAGLSTQYDGFQGMSSFVWFMSFPVNSMISAPSPFSSSYSCSDLYISMWFQITQQSAITATANLFKCTGTASTNPAISISVQPNQATGGLDLIASILSQSQFAKIVNIQAAVDLGAWNYIGVYVDLSDILYITLNSQTIVYQSLGGVNVLRSVIAYSNTCQVGGGTFVGNIMHLIVASGMLSIIQHYDSAYSHSVPLPTDPYIIAYYSFQSDIETKLTFNQFIGSAQISKNNEPSVVCQCLTGSEEQSSNYPRLNASLGSFGPIPNVPYPIANAFSAAVSFTINIRAYDYYESNLELISHTNLWSIGVYNQYQIYASIAGTFIVFDLSTIQPTPMRQQSLFLNYWINYTLTFNSSQATLIIDDLSSNTPIIITNIFTIPLQLTQVITSSDATGSFIFQPSEVDAAYSHLQYIVGGVQQFEFELSLDNFVQSNSNDPLNNQNYNSLDQMGYYQSGNFILNAPYPGVLFDQLPGPCNMSDPSFAFDGVACRDQQNYLSLNQQVNQVTRVEAFLTSTNNMFAFETWFRFNGMLPDYNASMMISVYGVVEQQYAQISILQGSEANLYSIQCDPNAKTPRTYGIQDPVAIYDRVNTNLWMHFACISNTSSDILSALLFDSSTSITYNYQTSQSFTISIPYGFPARTVFGSSNNFDQQFQGSLREMRFWSIVRSQQDIETFRFQSIPYKSPLRNSLMVYSMLSQGVGNQMIELEIVSYMNTPYIYLAQASISSSNIATQPLQSSTPISWNTDITAPMICPPDTIYNSETMCCDKADFYITIQKTTTIGVEDGNPYVVLQVIIHETNTGSNPITNGFYSLSWAITNVSNYPNSTNIGSHMASIQTIINSQPQDSEREILLLESVLLPNSSYTFQATVQSLVRNYYQYQSASYILMPICPQIKIFPSFSGNAPITISASMNPNLLILYLQVQSQCYSPQIQSITINWSVNSQQVSYTLTPDNMNMTFNSFTALSSFQVTATLSYSYIQGFSIQTNTISDTQTVNIIGTPFVLTLNSIPPLLDSTKSNIVIDASQYVIEVNYPSGGMQISYTLNCPYYLFYSSSAMAQYCSPDQSNGGLTIYTSNTAFVNYQAYNFVYTMQSTVLGFSQSTNFSVTFYQNAYYACPTLGLSMYTRYQLTDTMDYVVRPSPLLDCLQDPLNPNAPITHYTLSNIQWTVAGYPQVSQFLNINGLVATVQKASLGPTVLKPYFNTNITVSGTLSNGTLISSKTIFVMGKAPITTIVTQNPQNGIVPFNETMKLDASGSYDPDTPSTTLNCIWTFGGGQQNWPYLEFSLSPIDRLNNGYSIGSPVPQTFIANIINPSYPENPATQYAYMQFQAHSDYRVSMLLSSCVVTLTSNESSQSFSILNATDVWFQASINKTLCFPIGFQFTLTQGQLYSHVPDSLVQSGQTNYMQTNSVTVKAAFIQNMSPGTIVTVDFIYLAEFLDSIDQDTHYDYVVASARIVKVATPIVVQFVGIANLSAPVLVGQEESYTLDASSSFDYDYPSSNNTFSYSWTCPQGLQCEGTGPQYTITKPQRVSIHSNNIGSTLQIGVQIYSTYKSSSIVYVTLHIEQQFFSECLTVNLSNSLANTINVMRDQEFPLKLALETNNICQNVSITYVQWATSQQIPQFWYDGLSPTEITILKSSDLPQNVSVIKFNTVVSYTVYGSDQTSMQQLKYSFTINITGSDIVPIVTTNLLSSQIYDMGSSGMLELNASGSYDPDNATNSIVCQWQCSTQISTVQISNYSQCNLLIAKNQISFVNPSSNSEIAEFTVYLITLDGLKTSSKTIFITLVKPQITSVIPLCYIQNFNDLEYFDIDQQMLFYPKCLPSVAGQSYNGNFQFSWLLNPVVSGVALNQNYLDIPAMQLFQGLSNQQQGNLTIQLTVMSSDRTVWYNVQKIFDIPQIESYPSYILTVTPALPQPLFQLVSATISSTFNLDNNQFYRIRVLKTDYSQQIVISEFTENFASLYLPKNSMTLYLDIIMGRKPGNSQYNIMTVQAQNFYVQESSLISQTVFDFQIIPRLQAPPAEFYTNDYSQMMFQLENLIELQTIIQGVSVVANQAYYNHILFNQVYTLYNSTLIDNPQLLETPIQYRLLAGFFQILTQMYLVGCWNGNYQDESALYLQMINQTLLSYGSLQIIESAGADMITKNSYVQNLNLLVKSQCLTTDQQSLFANISNQVFASTLIEGQYSTYTSPFNKSQQSAIYKISNLDHLSSNLISLTSSDNTFSIATISQNLPMMASYLTISEVPISNANTSYQYGQTYTSSQSTVQLILYDKNFTKINMSGPNFGFSVNLTFKLQQQALQSINQMNQTPSLSVQCASMNDNETQLSLNHSDPSLITNLSNVNSGIVKCTSYHLSVFGVLYCPILVQVLPTDNNQYPINQNISIFDQIPLLKYFVPALFLVIILVLAVIGLIMSQLEYSRPKRFYNKLSLSENIQKYSYLRLLGCMILQFNPFSNYIFKPNFYISRAVRLLIIINYFLLISSANLIFYRGLTDGFLVADIFWFGIVLQVVILLVRPKIQELSLSLFYPVSLTNWIRRSDYKEKEQRPQSAKEKRKTKIRHTEKQQNDEVIVLDGDDNLSPMHRSRTIGDEDYNNDLENSRRLGNSEQRLIGIFDPDSMNETTKRKSMIDDTVEVMIDQNSPDATTSHNRKRKQKSDKGGKKQKKKKSEVKTHAEDVVTSKLNGDEEGRVQQLVSKFLKKEAPVQKVQQEIELTDISNNNMQKSIEDEVAESVEPSKKKSQKKKKELVQNVITTEMRVEQPKEQKGRNNQEELRHSNDSNMPFNGTSDYAGFAFDHIVRDQEAIDQRVQNQQQFSHQEPQNKDLSAQDFDDSNDLATGKDINEVEYEYYDEEEAYYDEENEQKEGGEIEMEDIYDKQSQNKRNVVGKQNNFKKRRRAVGKEEEVEVIDFANRRNEEEIKEVENYQDESTPSLESVYKNYRQLRVQKTDGLKGVIGVCIFILLAIWLTILHGVLLIDLNEYQFSNWISCALFTFMVMIFVVDTIQYALVAWALKSTNGIVDKRRCCSLINIMVLWPLGKYKFMELEIELAKLKDFDREYEMVAYA